VKLSPEGEKSGSNKKCAPKTLLWPIPEGSVKVTTDQAPLATGSTLALQHLVVFCLLYFFRCFALLCFAVLCCGCLLACLLGSFEVHTPKQIPSALCPSSRTF
jgi:hypothetical protein